LIVGQAARHRFAVLSVLPIVANSGEAEGAGFQSFDFNLSVVAKIGMFSKAPRKNCTLPTTGVPQSPSDARAGVQQDG
jgi:hypothetical protein